MYNILVVDDELWMCKGLKVVIEKHCPEFTVADMAYNGREALQLINENHYDLVITDIRMSEMDGLQLIESLKQQEHDIPIIVISGFDEFEYAQKALRLGVIDYLLKPLNKEDVKRVLEKIKETHLDSLEKQQKMKGFQGDDIVTYLKEVVENFYMDDLGIEPLANKTGYNPSYLSRVFKSDMGIGFIQYLTRKRMEVACKLLVETDLTMSHIAEKVGYRDDKYFIRIFKNHFESTPGEFRNHSQERNNVTP